MSSERMAMNSENDSRPEVGARSKWSVLEAMANKYDAVERSKIDQIKDDLRGDPYGEGASKIYMEQIGTRPSTLRKIGRLAMDRLGIHFGGSETRRRREAMGVAVKEYDAEQAEERLRLQERLEAAETKRIEEEKHDREAREKREKEDMEQSLIKGMEEYRKGKKERFQKQRIQELLERQVNDRLLTVDALEEEVVSGNPEVERDIRMYDGAEIPIYTLRGLPFSMLSHNVEYRRINSGNLDHIGVQTSAKVVEDPTVWTQDESSAMQEGGYGTRGGDARGNVISTSYINSESNLDNRFRSTDGHADLCYGFSHLDPSALLFVSLGDGATPNIVSKDRIFLKNGDEQIIQALESAGPKGSYNEFLFRRYSEASEAYKPDYIIAENGNITEDMLRHAKFFGIPIVNIDRAAYSKKMEDKAVAALELIDDESSYEDINRAIEAVKSLSKYDWLMEVESGIGKGVCKRHFEQRYLDNERRRKIGSENSDYYAMERRIIDLGRLEIEKRMDFIADELQKATEACLLATKEGRRYVFSSDSIDTIYDCSVLDKQNGKRYDEAGESDCGFKSAYNANEIVFNFSMKGSPRVIHTEIFDGERRAIDEDNKDDVANSDSSYYDKIYPIVIQYLLAVRENNEVTS